MLLLLSTSCASSDDNQMTDDNSITQVYNYVNSDNTDNQLSYADENSILNEEPVTNDVYFDSSAANDRGNGSKENPYQKLNTARIGSNNIIHMADGEYKINTIFNARNITFVGESAENTILTSTTLRNTNSSFIITNLTLLNCTLTNNGSLYMDNVIFRDSDKYINSIGRNMSINNSSFINCSNEVGGALYANDSNISMNNSRFINCSGLDGAGILARNSLINISNTLFMDNHSDNIGGAIVSLTSEMQITNVTFRNNSARYYGGSIYSIYGSMILEDSNFEYNNANDGGAIYIDEAVSCRIYNNNFTNNNADTNIVYLVSCNCTCNVSGDNYFKNNSALDIYESSIPNMFIGNGNYTMITYNYTTNDTLPDRYDLRQLGYVTSVKNQGSDGNCWAFGTLATLESCLLKASNITYDFSEDNMKNIMAQYSDYGWSFEVNVGGKDEMALGYLTSWLGPVYEFEDKYRVHSLLSPVLNSSIHLQNVLYLKRTNYTDNDDIKRALMTYGSVSANLAWDFSCVKNSSYFCNHESKINHAISIVGWDDNYSRDNFKDTPDGDGAWIIKNSWGENSGENGFYYISYYDKYHALASDLYTFIFNDSIRLDNNYQYDISGITDYYYQPSNTAWYKNVYSIRSNEYLEAVSTYFNSLTNYTISIYVNDELRHSQKSSSKSGYYTIYLDNKLALHKEDKLEIVFKVTTENDTGIPISEIFSLKKLYYGENISFVSYDGINWDDFYNLNGSYPNHTYTSQVASIKAFTQNMIASLNLTANNKNPCEITAHVFDQYGNAIDEGNVYFMIEDEMINATVNNGTAKITKSLPLGLNNITAVFNQEGYNQAQNSINVTVTTPPKEDCNIIITYERINDNLVINAEVINDNLTHVNGGKVVFKVNGKTLKDENGKVIYVKVDDGIATITYNLPDDKPRNITLTVVYSGTSNYQKSTNTTTIEIPKINPTFKITPPQPVYVLSTIHIEATIEDSSKIINEGKVIFKINGKTLKDTNGKVIYAKIVNNVAYVDYEISENYKPKSYTLTAVLISDYYNRVEASETLTVIKT